MINIYKTELSELADNFLDIVEVRTRRIGLRTMRNAFVGEDAVTAMVGAGIAETREEAVELGRRLQRELHLFSHVAGRLFQDEGLTYTLNRNKLTLGSWNYAEKPILKENARMFLQLIKLEDRYHFLRKYRDCFVGSEIVSSMVYSGLAKSRMEAVQLGRVLEQKFKLFHGKFEFADESRIYQLTSKGQMMRKKALKRAEKQKKKLGKTESKFQTDVVTNRIEKQLRSTYSTGFLDQVRDVNTEMKERAKKMYTGHHQIVSSDTSVTKVRTSECIREKCHPITFPGYQHLNDNSHFSCIKNDSRIKDPTISWNTECDYFSVSNRFAVPNESAREDTKDHGDIDDDFDEYTVYTAEDHSEEEEIFSLTDITLGVTHEAEQVGIMHSFQDVLSNDSTLVRNTFKELIDRLNPVNFLVSCRTALAIVENDGVAVIVYAMEVNFKRESLISFLGCLLLERLFLAAAHESSGISPSLLRDLIFQMEAVPLLLKLMKVERKRNVAAYQATRWLVNILYLES